MILAVLLGLFVGLAFGWFWGLVAFVVTLLLVAGLESGRPRW